MKILVVRYGTVGDSVLTSPFLRELRAAYPDAQIDVLGDVVSKGVFEFCPYIDNIITIEDKRVFFLKKYLNIFNVAKKIRGYDKVYYTRAEHFISMAAKLAGIPERIGYTNLRSKFLTGGSLYNEKIHIIDCTMQILESDNVPVNNKKMEVWIHPVYEAKVKNIIREINPDNKKLVVVHASTRIWQKNWLEGYWAEVLEYLVQRNDCAVVMVGAKKDIPIYKSILSKTKPDISRKIINMAGMFSIQETMALIKNSDFVIGLESGIMHIATALDKPSVLIHGSSPLDQFKPQNEHCRVVSMNYPCSPCIMTLVSKGIGCKTPPPKCFKDLTPDMVIKEVEKCL